MCCGICLDSISPFHSLRKLSSVGPGSRVLVIKGEMWNGTSGCWPSWRGWEQVCQCLHEPSWCNVIITGFGRVPPPSSTSSLLLPHLSLTSRFTSLLLWNNCIQSPFHVMHASGSWYSTADFPCTTQCVLLLPISAAAPSLPRERFSSLSVCSRMCALTNSSCGHPAPEPLPCLSWDWWDGPESFPAQHYQRQ